MDHIILGKPIFCQAKVPHGIKMVTWVPNGNKKSHLISPWPFMFWTPPLPQAGLPGSIQLCKVSGSRSSAHPLSPSRGARALPKHLASPTVSPRLERVDVDRVVDGAVGAHGTLGGQEFYVGQGALAGEGPGAQEFTWVYAAKLPTAFLWSKLTEVVQFYNVITIRRFYASSVEVRMRN